MVCDIFCEPFADRMASEGTDELDRIAKAGDYHTMSIHFRGEHFDWPGPYAIPDFFASSNLSKTCCKVRCGVCHVFLRASTERWEGKQKHV
jgi:hypothetical protein